ncbi:hypothetical protein G4B88_018411 [Cannabis sativa]|uniref:DUF4283 domain-containing protein n=1 Tax=Cannabis sativa TaxID=3483 RepID=A0A7J6DLD2_CANSA|nr:hypothetical protein G4B88_018411 [Cannabis sativa]
MELGPQFDRLATSSLNMGTVQLSNSTSITPAHVPAIFSFDMGYEFEWEEILEDVMNLVENVAVEDFSLDLVPDDINAKGTIRRTLVGKFFSKRKTDALKVMSRGPWGPCGGFLLVTSMPDNGKWQSTDLQSVYLWVRLLGVPYRYITDENVGKIANRVGTLISADKTRVLV